MTERPPADDRPGEPTPDEPQGSWVREPSRPDHAGRWNPLTHQPYSGTSHLQRLWMSRGDMFSIGRMIGRNLRHAWPTYRAYLRTCAALEPPQAVDRHRIGLGISPTAANFDRTVERVEELGVRSLLVRIPFWNPAPALALRARYAELKNRGFRFIFGLLQDRRAALTPALWGRFVMDCAAELEELEPTFQLGQAINRKKWGVWHPDEYLRMMEAAAPARDRFPRCRWIGPPVIDFEYHVTMYYLFSHRPFDFDGIAALLYVDRRGSPDGMQYHHFDLRRKVLLLRAIVETSPQRDVPIYLTEFNWPLKGKDAHAPAGRAVQTDEERQALYMVIYYLTALSISGVAGVFWWQLVARGYGLCEEDEEWTRRPSYEALRILLLRAAGATVARVSRQQDGIRGFVLRHPDAVTLVLYADADQARLTCARSPDEAHDLAGRPLPVGSATIEIPPSPTYFTFAGERPEDLLAACGLTQDALPA